MENKDFTGRLFCECKEFLDVDVKALSALRRVARMYRNDTGRVLVVNSGSRCEKCNKAVGGSPTSTHLEGRAFDVQCLTSGERYSLLRILFEINVNRIGIADRFIHFDISNKEHTKAPEVIWMY